MLFALFDRWLAMKILVLPFLFFFLTKGLAEQTRQVMIVANYDLDDSLMFCNNSISNKLHFIRASQNENGWQYIKEKTFEQAMDKVHKGKDLVLFVHGDGKCIKDIFKASSSMASLYDVDVIAFIWPSKVYRNGVRNFKNSRKNVGLCFNNFIKTIQLIQEYERCHPDKHSINLMLHSLGNLYLKILAESQADYKIKQKLFDNIILNAPAVPAKGYQTWVELLNIQNRIIITQNRKDFVLKGLHYIITWKKQMGESAWLTVAKNAYVVDFTRAVGLRRPFRDSHTYFYGNVVTESTCIRNFYNDLFHGSLPDFNNSTMFNKKREGYRIIK